MVVVFVSVLEARVSIIILDSGLLVIVVILLRALITDRHFNGSWRNYWSGCVRLMHAPQRLTFVLLFLHLVLKF